MVGGNVALAPVNDWASNAKRTSPTLRALEAEMCCGEKRTWWGLGWSLGFISWQWLAGQAVGTISNTSFVVSSRLSMYTHRSPELVLVFQSGFSLEFECLYWYEGYLRDNSSRLSKPWLVRAQLVFLGGHLIVGLKENSVLRGIFLTARPDDRYLT